MKVNIINFLYAITATIIYTHSNVYAFKFRWFSSRFRHQANIVTISHFQFYVIRWLRVPSSVFAIHFPTRTMLLETILTSFVLLFKHDHELIIWSKCIIECSSNYKYHHNHCTTIFPSYFFIGKRKQIIVRTRDLTFF